MLMVWLRNSETQVYYTNQDCCVLLFTVYLRCLRCLAQRTWRRRMFSYVWNSFKVKAQKCFSPEFESFRNCMEIYCVSKKCVESTELFLPSFCRVKVLITDITSNSNLGVNCMAEEILHHLSGSSSLAWLSVGFRAISLVETVTNLDKGWLLL